MTKDVPVRLTEDSVTNPQENPSYTLKIEAGEKEKTGEKGYSKEVLKSDMKFVKLTLISVSVVLLIVGAFNYVFTKGVESNRSAIQEALNNYNASMAQMDKAARILYQERTKCEEAVKTLRSQGFVKNCDIFTRGESPSGSGAAAK